MMINSILTSWHSLISLQCCLSSVRTKPSAHSQLNPPTVLRHLPFRHKKGITRHSSTSKIHKCYWKRKKKYPIFQSTDLYSHCSGSIWTHRDNGIWNCQEYLHKYHFCKHFDASDIHQYRDSCLFEELKHIQVYRYIGMIPEDFYIHRWNIHLDHRYIHLYPYSLSSFKNNTKYIFCKLLYGIPNNIVTITLSQVYSPLDIGNQSILVNLHIVHFLDKDLVFASIHFRHDTDVIQYHKYS